MIAREFVKVLFLQMVCASALASTNSCTDYAKSLSIKYGRPVQCHCGSDLSKVTLTLPKGIRLKRACNLHNVDWQNVDPRAEGISLDKYDEQGNTLFGSFLLDGELKLTGRIRFEPSDGGDLWFYPHHSIFKVETAFEPNFRYFKFFDERAYRKFRVPTSLRQNPACAEANAKVVLRGINVEVDDSDGAGAYPLELEVLQVSTFKPCKPNS